MLYHRLLFLAVGLLIPLLSLAQEELPFQRVVLSDFSFFKPAAGWSLAGEVSGFPGRTVLYLQPGTGVLVFQDDQRRAAQPLLSSGEYGDIDLSFDFMVAEGARVGIFLQGAYRVQLADSWGLEYAGATDCGGILDANGSSSPGKGGHSPRINACKAPGLWQHLEIRFQAPVFNTQGQKVRNARIVRMKLNEFLIHENVEITGTSPGALSPTEKPFGPLAMLGEQGVAGLKNIAYKTYSPEHKVSLENIEYTYYEGKFETIPDLSTLKSLKKGKAAELSWHYGMNENKFLFEYSGFIRIPKSGTYLFNLLASGPTRLSVNQKQLLSIEGFERNVYKAVTVDLPEGLHPFTLVYTKHFAWLRPTLGWFAEGPAMNRHALHGNGAISIDDSNGPIIATPQAKPYVLRSFVKWNDQVKTTGLSVGEPSKINYSVDLTNGCLLQVWKGDFANTYSMWHNRGEGQLIEPLGPPIAVSSAPIVARLAGKNAAWPEDYDPETFRRKGYELDKAGRPVFEYQFEDIRILDRITPLEGNKYLKREVEFEALATANTFYYLLGAGEQIEDLGKNRYSINGKQYFIQLLARGADKPFIRASGNRQELLLPIQLRANKASVSYSIIW